MADASERTGFEERSLGDFWSQVEAEVARADGRELSRFARAAALPFELRAGFEDELLDRLRHGLFDAA